LTVEPSGLGLTEPHSLARADSFAPFLSFSRETLIPCSPATSPICFGYLRPSPAMRWLPVEPPIDGAPSGPRRSDFRRRSCSTPASLCLGRTDPRRSAAHQRSWRCGAALVMLALRRGGGSTWPGAAVRPACAAMPPWLCSSRYACKLSSSLSLLIFLLLLA
jgi:hypothetical protein